MKKIFTTLLVALAVALAACGDEKAKDQADWFLTPEAVVDGTTVEVSCLTRFGDGVLSAVGAGFIYQPVGEVAFGDFTVVSDCRVDGSRLSCTLNDLMPEMTYVVWAYADLPAGRVQSAGVAFETGKGGGPDPDPDPDPGVAKYKGWAELPKEKLVSGDYYYAYHMRSDAAKIRNYSVCYSAKYRCPVWVAAPMHDSYKGNAKRRDKYIDDPDIPCTQNTEYDHSTTNLTRGHMLGSSDRTVTQATNDQVFYKSNIGPQLQAGFNMSGGVWNNCESWVSSQWVGKADTTYQVIGCYWQDESLEKNGTIVPTHYYKVLLRTKNHLDKWVVDCTGDELQCVAVLFPHDSSNSGVKPSQYVSKGFAMSVADLEQKTGLTFFTNVPNAPKDTFNPADWGL